MKLYGNQKETNEHLWKINRNQLNINQTQLTSILSAIGKIETQAMDAGISLAPSKASDIVSIRGVLEPRAESDET